MGVKFQNVSPRTKWQPNVLKLVLKFPPNGPHKTTFGFLKFVL